MAYKSAADGPVVKKGKTNAKVFPNDGAKVSIEKGGKKTAGVKNVDLKSMGRGLAKVKNQKGK
jgi:hypothetical protein